MLQLQCHGCIRSVFACLLLTLPLLCRTAAQPLTQAREAQRRVDRALTRALHRDDLTLRHYATLQRDIARALLAAPSSASAGIDIVLDGTTAVRVSVSFPSEDVSEAALRFCTAHAVAVKRCFAVVQELARLEPSCALQPPSDHVALFATPTLLRRCPHRARVYIEIERLLGRLTPLSDGAESTEACVTLDGDAANPVWCGPLPPRETTFFDHSLLPAGAHALSLHWATKAGAPASDTAPMHSVFFWISVPRVRLSNAAAQTPPLTQPPPPLLSSFPSHGTSRWTRAAAVTVDVSLTEFCPGSDEGELCFLIDGHALWCGEQLQRTRTTRSRDAEGAAAADAAAARYSRVEGGARGSGGGLGALRSSGRRRIPRTERRPLSADAASAHRRARSVVEQLLAMRRTRAAPTVRLWWQQWWQQRSWNRREGSTAPWPLCSQTDLPLGSRARAAPSDVVRLHVVLPPELVASVSGKDGSSTVTVQAMLLHGEMRTKVLATSDSIVAPLVGLPSMRHAVPLRARASSSVSAAATRWTARVGAVAQSLLALEASEWGVHSQNGEDGVILALFQLLGGIRDGIFFEFGVEDGSERNTRLLFESYGWRGALLDGGYDNASIALHQHWITAENINELLVKYLAPLNSSTSHAGHAGADAGGHAGGGGGEREPARVHLDLLSIDIDYNDYWVWEAILTKRAVLPRVVIVEINSHGDIKGKRSVPYEPSGQWDGKSNFHGGSVAGFDALARRFGYTLVYCESHGVNCFFVLDEDLRRLVQSPLAARLAASFGLLTDEEEASDSLATVAAAADANANAFQFTTWWASEGEPLLRRALSLERLHREPNFFGEGWRYPTSEARDGAWVDV
jgi:hypothetical protein